MRAHRLQRLKLLTQGVALLGLGGAEAACHDPPDSVHINSPYVAPDAGASPTTNMNAPYIVYDAGNMPPPTPSASASDSATPGAGKPPLQVATGAAPSSTLTAPPGTPRPPWLIPHMNATATPPKPSPPRE